MAKLLYSLEGVRGRHIDIYDRKCVITTSVSFGSILTGNATDGAKTIFFTDVIGLQFKKSAATIGYLQFETASMQMNNQNSNTFSENTFTFENNKNGLTNEFMESVYRQIGDILEELKYGNVTADATAPAAAPAAAPAPAPAPAPNAAPFCTTCGAPLTPGAAFCTVCGQKL